MPEEKKSLLTSPLIFGTTAAILIGLLGILVLASCTYFTNFSELYLRPAGTVLYLLGAFAGGFLATKKSGGKALLYGAQIGIAYFLFFSLILLLTNPAALSAAALGIKGIYALVAAVAGGACGIAFS
ncbi:MAG: hypothetical protein PWP44_582 [Thermacetogenium sp.]|jgi:putative membrane protein (TIGR04086 family)|uniref:TIGR04086 family membrane protein n=1 Tax=Thermacetogenium phaeum TaxID=85874 RepID=A0A101FHS4_9THEO|nr:MAG: Uncharacterized protein XD66_0013 [Thermacetogenium phaeum]MDN5365379.1 hypothetical protein [Thermacetogenium sp.]